MNNEPAITVGLATTFLGALLLLLRAFGVQLSDEQSGAILQFIDAGWPFLALVPGLAGYLVVRSRVVGPQTARRHGIDPRTGELIEERTPPDGSVRRTSVLLVLLALGFSGCASLAGGGWKPVASLGNDAAQAICAEVYAEQKRLSLEEAGEQFCSTLDQLQPFIELATRAKSRAVERGLR